MINVKTVLFPTDFSDTSLGAAKQILGLCKDLGATLEVIHVVELDAFTNMYGHSASTFGES